MSSASKIANIHYKKGDLFANLPDDKKVMIPHVCNDIGAWGSGFVLAVSKYSDKPKEDYLRFIKNIADSYLDATALGVTCFSRLDNGNVVANMVAQTGIGGKHPLRYFQLMECMRQVRRNMNGKYFPDEIYCPKFGSGLAGGHWPTIERMIIECWVDKGIDVTVFEL